jgi:predicted chitinase/LysM repeat protein
MRTHTISSGETLSRIAQRFNTTVDALAKANNIQNPNMIISGRNLTIPDAPGAGERIRSRLQQDGFDAAPARAASAPGSIPSPASGQFDGTRPAPGTTNTQAWIPVEAPLQGSPSNRNADTYADVIDQFGVASNPRYQPRDGNTYCNIFAWDVTKAMGAEIPHWVDGAGNPTGVGQGRELDANGGHLWLQNHGPAHGWREVSAQEAQQMANQGHPTVASWHNPGGIGHIGVVRPGEINERGPALAQAGARNFNEGHVKDSFGNANVKYFVNDRGTATQGPAEPAPSTPSAPTEPTPSEPTAPTGAARFSVPQSDMQRGSQGEDVRQLQSALVNLGYMTQGQMDTGPGTFGPQTEASLKGFQADRGLDADGVYGPMTRGALTQAASAPRFSVPQNDLQRGSQGEEVRQLQSALVDLGYMTQGQMDTGPGTFGPQTEASLKRFQADHGVPSTGYYGPLTREALTAKAGGSSGPTGPGPVTGPGNEPGPAGGVSMQQLRSIMPHLSEARAQQMLPHLNAAMQEAGINTPKRQAAFLAQLAHESGEFRYMEEIASGADYEGRTDLGNTQPGDGVRYKGRGPIQLTGRSNYRAAGQALGIDLENNPTRAADPDVGFRTAAWYWNNRNLNQYADAGNFDAITYRVNGGYNGKASRDAYYARALQVLGG